MNCKEYPLKGHHLTYSICGGSIHETKVLLQDKRVKPSTGDIWLDVKVWDLFKDTINQVKVGLFLCLFCDKDTTNNSLM